MSDLCKRRKETGRSAPKTEKATFQDLKRWSGFRGFPNFKYQKFDLKIWGQKSFRPKNNLNEKKIFVPTK